MVGGDGLAGVGAGTRRRSMMPVGGGDGERMGE